MESTHLHFKANLAWFRGIPMSHKVRKRNGLGWRQGGHCLFTLAVNCPHEIKHPVSAGRGSEPLTGVEENSRWKRKVWGKTEGYIVFVLLSPRHVMFSYLFSLPCYSSHLPILQLEDMTAFLFCDSLYGRFLQFASPPPSL